MKTKAKNRGGFYILLVLCLFCLAGFQFCSPDLVVSKFTVSDVTIETDPNTNKQYWVADCEVEVKNTSTKYSAGKEFWVGTKAGWENEPDYGMYGWKFTVPGQFDKKGAWKCPPLGPGESKGWVGKMYIWEYNPNWAGTNIDLWVKIDIPIGTPPEDIIAESNENNNSSQIITKSVPQ
jgi:hypothetical protein